MTMENFRRERRPVANVKYFEFLNANFRVKNMEIISVKRADLPWKS